MAVAGVGLVYNPGLGHCQFATKLAGTEMSMCLDACNTWLVFLPKHQTRSFGNASVVSCRV